MVGKKTMTNIILCGGNGTRLWPISRTLMPKQFVKIFEDTSLFQLTLRRNNEIFNTQHIILNTEQYFIASEQISELHNKKNYLKKSTTFLLEPVGRNTAAAIALSCFALDANEIVFISSSDHLIKNKIEYLKIVERAIRLAKLDNLVIFGIPPTYPEVGYGYIEAQGEDVKSFHEKPNKRTADEYLLSKNFYWNSGMFCFKVGVFLEELKKYSFDIYNTSKIAYERSIKDHKNHIVRILHDDMIEIPDNSIDYAVMEKSDKVKVIKANIGWSDLGSFDALDLEIGKDINGNTVIPNLYTVESKNNFLYTQERAIALVGIEDLIIVDTRDALLISKKGMSQQVKQVVSQLKASNTQIHHVHNTVQRPWGTYTILEDIPGYKIKRIVVKPGKRLSLQKHLYRSEHWIVVSGTATVTIGNKISIIHPNESTYIKIGEVHRLANEGKIDIVLIEAQVGKYTGEDDIIRVEDDFQRT
jgi:mannose-1-phosphate guanylyltransferase